MGLLDRVLDTMRANERVVERALAAPFGIRTNLPIPPGPAAMAQRLRQGRGLMPSGFRGELPLRGTIASQTPADVRVETI